MVIMTKQQQFILIAANCNYLALAVITVYFTRATSRRVAGALLGGIAVALVGVGIELVAHTLGWWRYPFVETSYGPPLMYPVVVFLFTMLALIGWRVTRRFGWRGQAAYLAAVTFLGTVRDYGISAWLPDFIDFAPGFSIVFIDAACWAVLLVLAQVAMGLVAGPVKGDALARRPRGSLSSGRI
jgi:hypothetical protein